MRCLVLVLTLLLLPMASAQPTFVLHNARIYTVDADQPMAAAMAVEDGRIVAVGSEADMLDAYSDWPRMDAEGHTVVPGLIDAHAHLMGLGQFLTQVDLVGTNSKEEVLVRAQAFAETLPEGAWLMGRGWDQNDWPAAADGSYPFPTRSDLDTVFPDRPVWLRRVDGHAGWVNAAALRVVGIDPNALAPRSPLGGEILVDEAGRPSGIFLDEAESRLIEDLTPSPSPDELDERLRRALERTARFGLTGVHEAGIKPDTLAAYRRALKDGTFSIRNYAMIDGVGPLLNALCAEGLVQGEDDRLWVRALKLYADGALGSRGAALLAEYSDDPGNVGLLQFEPEVFQRIVTRAMQCGLQVNTHAIGDRGTRMVLDAYEAAITETGGGPGRHRIEHAQIVALEDIPRFAELGLIASMQPTHATSDMPWAEDRVGAERIQGAYAWQRFREAGVPLALGSDFPVEQVNPLLGFYAAVTRQDPNGEPPDGWMPDQRLTREEALRGFTLDAAYAAFMEDEVGSLEPGKWADFVLLSHDIMTVPAEQILATEVIATVLGGEVIYSAD
ncbi:MAG: amidohydrolase [Rhodothermaceae bacterium]|nr:amidohydrolase [Rhodothermaceae bacterium]